MGETERETGLMSAKVTTIVFDAGDPPALAAFWADVLGWTARRPDEDGEVVVVPRLEESSFILLFIPVAEPKSAKNRVHLDVNPVGVEQQEELERLLQLGATQIDIGQGEQTWHVLADPEGNEFCLLRRTLDG